MVEPEPQPQTEPTTDPVAPLFDATSWQVQYEAAAGHAAVARLRRGKLLTAIATDTVRVCAAGEYVAEGRTVKLHADCDGGMIHLSLIHI